MKSQNLNLDDLRSLYLNKESFYNENWTLLHITIKSIEETIDGYRVIAKVHNTPGFTEASSDEYIFEPMLNSSSVLHGTSYGYGSIRRIESINSLKQHFEAINPGQSWPTKVLNRHQHSTTLRKIFGALLRHNQYTMQKYLFWEPMRKNENSDVLQIIDEVLKKPDAFLKWPQKRLLFIPGAVRGRGFVDYTNSQVEQLKRANITPDRRNNGPAIMAYLLAGGQRPKKNNGHGWTIHHVYDGKFPFCSDESVCHAVKEPEHFTQTAGLVALHPIADSLASESCYFSWYLRLEAFRRFDYAPYIH